MKKFLCLVCALFITLSGCSSTTQDVPSNDVEVMVYCMRNADIKKATRELISVERNFSNKLGPKRLVEAIITEMKNLDGYETRSVLPANVNAEQIIFYGNSVVVNLSKEYNKLSSIDKSLAAGALALTLTQIDTINFVKISCVDAKYDQANDFYLNVDSIVLSEDAIRFNAFEVEIIAINKIDNRLQKRKVIIKTEQDKVLANMIFAEMLHKPQEDILLSPIPDGLLVRTIKMNNGICEIDFMDADFNSISKLDSLHIAAIANTFCMQPDIKAVKIKVDGKHLSEYGINGFDGEIAYNKKYD